MLNHLTPAILTLKSGWLYLWQQDPWVLLMGAICVPCSGLLFYLVTFALQPLIFWGGLIVGPILAVLAIARFVALLLHRV